MQAVARFTLTPMTTTGVQYISHETAQLDQTQASVTFRWPHPGLFKVCYKLQAGTSYSQVGNVLEVVSASCSVAREAAPAHLLVDQHQCGIRGVQLGNFDSADQCAAAVYKHRELGAATSPHV